MDVFISGFSFVGVILAIVELLKKFGLTGNKLIAISATVGVMLGVGYKLSLMYAAVIGPWFEVAIFGIVAGLVASGAYSFVDARWPKTE